VWGFLLLLALLLAASQGQTAVGPVGTCKCFARVSFGYRIIKNECQVTKRIAAK
jgi:hypothetical protein